MDKLVELYGDLCISDKKGYECYGKTCVCLVCGEEKTFCVDDPCLYCDGKEGDRSFENCIPDKNFG